MVLHRLLMGNVDRSIFQAIGRQGTDPSGKFGERANSFGMMWTRQSHKLNLTPPGNVDMAISQARKTKD